MKRIFIIVYAAFLIILLANYFYYRDLYRKQINYISELLDRQVSIVGLQVDETNNGFLSDLNLINFSEDLTQFFTNTDHYTRAIDRMKLFFTKYEQFISGMKFFDNNKNEFTLKKDSETGEWLGQSSVLHVQAEIYPMEMLVQENRRYNYYLPVIDRNTDVILGNIVVTVDFQKYFKEIFTTFNLKDYQWQWVVSDSGQIIYDNFDKNIQYSDIQKISNRIAEGSVENTIHSAIIDGKKTEIISSYYATGLLQRDLGVVFSSSTATFQKYIIRNSLFIVIGTLLLIQIIIYIFWKYIRLQKSDKKKIKNAEKLLNRMIEEMPVGFVIYNKDRQILKANKLAADKYSFNSSLEMKGAIFPDVADSMEDDRVSSGIDFMPGQIITLKKENSELALLRKNFPLVYKGQEATMEILTDVSELEFGRREEARANSAKSEFLSRFSYEIRTSLNGIVSMTDVLWKYDLSEEIRDLVKIMRRSAEVLIALANNIIDFSRIESGKMILEELPFNLRKEINYSMEFARTGTTEKVNISCSVSPDVPENIIGDPFRMRHVLSSLLNHSVRNTEKGEILLKCHSEGRKDGIITLEFEISDTGKSLDNETLKRIFGDPEDLDPKFKRAVDDTDFGIILSRQLIGLMGGKLVAHSPSGLSGEDGTKILFTINVYSNDRIEKKIPSVDEITSFRSINTLVIAGSARDEDVLPFLHQMGLAVTITTFMKTTIPQIKANKNFPDDRYKLIIILDDQNFNGFEAATALWENNLSNGFFILMVSSNDKKGNYLKCISMGVDHYLVKPGGLNEIREVIKNMFPNVGKEPEKVAESTSPNNLRILVVEDNKLNQKVIGAILGRMGYSFDIAEDGYAAYLQAKVKQYDLILMDLLLPEMNGFEASQKILKADGHVKIIALTADIMPETKKKSELAGIIDFISKPMTTEDLKRVIDLHFRK